MAKEISMFNSKMFDCNMRVISDRFRNVVFRVYNIIIVGVLFFDNNSCRKSVFHNIRFFSFRFHSDRCRFDPSTYYSNKFFHAIRKPSQYRNSKIVF